MTTRCRVWLNRRIRLVLTVLPVFAGSLPALLLIGACGDTASRRNVSPGAGDLQEGTRLKIPIWWTADGFTQQQGRIYDSAREEDCVFMVATDGRQRCMPAVFGRADPVTTFADPGCTQPLVGADMTIRYARIQVTGAVLGGDCAAYSFEYRELAENFEADEIYVKSDAGCTPTARPVVRLVRASYRHAGPVLSPDLFVGADEVVATPAADERLAVVSLRADDGAVIHQGLFDTAEGGRCQPQRAGDGESRCLPTAKYSSVPFSGAFCSGLHDVNQTYCWQREAHIIAKTSVECPRRIAIHAVKGSGAEDATINWSSAECVDDVGGLGPPVEIGAELDPGRFVAMDLDRSGTQRLRKSAYTDGKGTTVPENALWVHDSVLQEPCAFSDLGGQIRCVPAVMPTTVFGDATCRQAVAAIPWQRIDTCDPLPDVDYLLVRTRLHRRGEKVDLTGLPVFTLDRSGVCTPASELTLPDSGIQFFAIGAPLNIELVAATGALTAAAGATR